MTFVLRLFLVMLLSLGLLLPRVSVMIAEVTGAERVIFCDGTAMVVLALDEDGTPERMSHDEDCGLLLVNLPELLADLGRDAPMRPLRRASARRVAPASRRQSRAHPPRAPPFEQSAKA